MSLNIRKSFIVKIQRYILDLWVLLWGDNVTVFEPDNVRQGISNGFDSQLNQSALFYSDVLQLLDKLRTCEAFSSCGW